MMRGSQNSYFHKIYGCYGTNNRYKVKALEIYMTIILWQCVNLQIVISSIFVADFLYCWCFVQILQNVVPANFCSGSYVCKSCKLLFPNFIYKLDKLSFWIFCQRYTFLLWAFFLHFFLQIVMQNKILQIVALDHIFCKL